MFAERSARRPPGTQHGRADAAAVRPALDPHEAAAAHFAAALDRLPEHAAGRPIPAGPSPLRRALDEPGQPLPPRSRSYFEARLGRDLGAVRVHAGVTAGATARAIGAAAYAVGADIAFAPGRYAPESDAGRRLLAHELAHVAQQAGGSPAMPAGAPPAGIQRSIETIGGSWAADRYEGHPTELGLIMERLTFTPNDRVEATCIALVQSVRTHAGGKAAFANVEAPTDPDAARDARIRKARSDAAGRHIDSPTESVSPLYWMDSPDKLEQGLAGGKPRGNSGTGHRIGFLGLTLSAPAWLSDFPGIHDPPAPAGQEFETAALAIAGPQAGTYYGSVTWGWHLPADAARDRRGPEETDLAYKRRRGLAMQVQPLQISHMSAPGAGFLSATEAWNPAKSAAGKPTQDLPLEASAASLNISRPPEAMTDAQIAFRLAEIARVLRDIPATNRARAELGKGALATRSLRFEQAALLAVQQSRRARGGG